MEATEQPLRPQREGFQRAETNGGQSTMMDVPPPPESPGTTRPGPHALAPQPPLPSQLKSEQPVPEPPLDKYDEARRDIREKAETWPITVQLLYKPLTTPKGEVLWSLSFRQPRAAEINRIGNPTRVLWDSEILIEERKMTYIMGELCGIQPPLLDNLDPRDWNTCALRLRNFFLADLRGW